MLPCYICNAREGKEESFDISVFAEKIGKKGKRHAGLPNDQLGPFKMSNLERGPGKRG